MKRFAKVIGKIVLGVLLGVILLIVAVQIVLSTSLPENLVRKWTAENMKTKVELADLSASLLSHFPKLTFEIDSLQLSSADTLLSVGSLVISVNPMKLLDGTLRISDAQLNSPRILFRKFSGAESNWTVLFNDFASDSKDEDTLKTGNGLKLSGLSIGRARLTKPRVFYDAKCDTVSAAFLMKALELGAEISFSQSYTDIEGLHVEMDSMLVAGRLPSDTLAFGVDSLRVREDENHYYELELGSRFFARTKNFGRLQIPFSFSAGASYLPSGDSTLVDLKKLRMELAHIPLSSSGRAVLYPDRTFVDASVNVDKCDLGAIFDEYARTIVKAIPDSISLKAKLDANASAKGWFSSSEKPLVNAGLLLAASTEGLDLNVDALVKNALGDNPKIKLESDGVADIETLMKYLPDSLGMKARGKVKLNLKTLTSKAHLAKSGIDKAYVAASLSSEKVFFEMPDDTLKAVVKDLNIGASIKNVKNRRGVRVPRAQIEGAAGKVFVRSGQTKLMLGNLDLEAAIQKKSGRKRGSGPRPDSDFARDSALLSAPLQVNVDSTVTKFLREWNPSGNLALGRVGVSTPTFPLRMRIGGFSAGFTANEIHLDSMRFSAGSSDIAARGKIKGLRRALSGRGEITAALDLRSKRLNLNELLAARELGAKISDSVVVSKSETEDSFVVDTLSAPSGSVSLIEIPSNIHAVATLHAECVDYSDLLISNFSTGLRMQNRTLQLTGTKLSSNFGNMALGAFYSTPSRADASFGVDLNMSDVSAAGIIHLLPSVDNMMPALKSFEGLLGCDISATANVDTCMNIVMPSLNGTIAISGRNLNISDAGDLKKITRLLLFRNKNIGKIQDMNVGAVIHDNRLEIYPFELSVDRYRFALQGEQAFDGRMSYHVSVLKMPVILFPFGININGSTDDWKFSLGGAKYKKGQVPVYTQQLDTMHVNIVDAINNIFKRGVNEALSSSRSLASALDRKASTDGVDLTAAQTAELGNVVLDLAESELNSDIDAEVQAILDSTPVVVPTLPVSEQDSKKSSSSRRRSR